MTFAAPLKVTLRLIVFDVDQETGAKSVKDIKEQDVYMGDMPLMTDNGTFIVNGTERVIVSQMHRSPGVFFDHDKGKTHSSGKLLFAARIIPYRGSWLDIEFDAKDIVHARIDRRRKIPVTSLLYRARPRRRGDPRHLLQPASPTRATKDGWRVPVRRRAHEGLQGDRPTSIDAETGEVVLEAGKKLTARTARQLAEKGVKALRVARRGARRPVHRRGHRQRRRPARSTPRPATRSPTSCSKRLDEAGYDEIPVLDIDHVNIGAYIRNTLAVDKNSAREEALFDIYRVMRPGEPPTLDTAEAMFHSLFFDSERYDLSAVGRVKMNMRLDLDAEDTVRTLRKEDILAVIKALVDLRDGKGEIDDIDHLGNRRVRSVGELMENQYRLGLLRMERAIKERMSLGRDRHRDAAGPDQRQAGGGGGARVLRLLAALAVHGPDQPALRDHPQAPPLGARAGRPDPRARRLRGARRAPDPLRPHLPDRDAGRPEYRPDQLARDLRAGEQVRLHRDARSARVKRRQGHRRGRLSLGDGGGEVQRRPGQRRRSTRAAS